MDWFLGKPWVNFWHTSTGRITLWSNSLMTLSKLIYEIRMILLLHSAIPCALQEYTTVLCTQQVIVFVSGIKLFLIWGLEKFFFAHGNRYRSDILLFFSITIIRKANLFYINVHVPFRIMVKFHRCFWILISTGPDFNEWFGGFI